MKLEFRMAFLSQFNGLGAEVDADAPGRFHGGEKVPQPATDLQNLLSLRNEEAEVVLSQLVVEALALHQSQLGTFFEKGFAVHLSPGFFTQDRR